MFDQIEPVGKFTLPEKIVAGIEAFHHRAIGQQLDVMWPQTDEKWVQSDAGLEWFEEGLIHERVQIKSCSFSRTTKTGQGAARTTRSAVLPMQKCFQPV